MSDPNARARYRQWMLLGAALSGIALLIAAGMYLLEPADPLPREKPKTVKLTAPGNIDDRDVWRQKEGARVKGVETSIGEIEKKQRRYEEEQKRLQVSLDELKAGKSAPSDTVREAENKIAASRAKAVLDSPLPATSAGSRGSSTLRSPGLEGRGAAREISETPAPSTAPGAGNNIELIRFPVAGDAGEEAGGSAARRKEEKLEFDLIPAGSFVRVVMLNGVDAPTGGQAQSNPLPIAFHVEDTANLANKHRLDIRDCRIIAVAWGDVSSERTMGRTETLNCIINGEAVEMSIKGTLMGEDGKVGIRGRLVTKQGQILANALFAGALGGIGRAFQAAASTITTGGGGVSESVDPSRVAQAGIGGGVGQASTMLAQYYLKAADKLYPVIETDGGRVVEILITKSAVYTGKRTGAEQYQSLLHRASAAQRSDRDD